MKWANTAAALVCHAYKRRPHKESKDHSWGGQLMKLKTCEKSDNRQELCQLLNTLLHAIVLFVLGCQEQNGPAIYRGI
jgi:hypothetical protein